MLAGDTAPSVEDVHHAARRLVALECAGFLDGANIKLEKWAPYCRWVRELDDAHTVITFNYDLLPDKLGGLNVLLPNAKGTQTGVRVLKLHGSVDWKRDANDEVTRTGLDDSPARCGNSELVIATPGPTKLSEANKLEPLWEIAKRAIKEASAIVFVGYRFPPSDSQARQVILGAINGNLSNHLDLHVVLGPEVHSAPVARLSAMLTFAARTARRTEGRRQPPGGDFRVRSYRVHTHPLYGEDFLSVFTKRVLLGEYD
jgi:hypothetical protein